MNGNTGSRLIESAQKFVEGARRKARALTLRGSEHLPQSPPVMSVAPVGLLALLSLSVMPLQSGACAVPGANSALSKVGGLIVSGIGLAAVTKFGGGFIVGLFTGAGGKLKVLRLLAVGAVAGIVALNFQGVITYAIGGSLDTIGLGCMFGGGGGSGDGSSSAAALAPAFALIKTRT